MCPVPPLLSADTSDEKDPVPPNEIADVDPLTVDPRLSSGDNRYMHIIQNELASIIKGKGGNRKLINDDIITTSTPTVGRKITREFCLGEETSGDKTEFGMKTYYEHENNKVEESLSRNFSQTDEVNKEEHSDSENTKSKLHSLKQLANEFQASEENEAQWELRNYQMNEEEGYEDFFELKDIYGPDDTVSFFSGGTVTSEDLSES